MIETIAFQTRARTIDHLGREQIADCPTAISELWKNAYDAYARKVALHIFDGDFPVAAIVDDGHGMNCGEFVEKWLVVGTESKATESEISEEDRDGLPERTKQGQKGIGRLSCAALGPLLLVVSKRRNDPFVASLIDWRLFENPFLMLRDIKIPVIEFDRKEELISLLPDVYDRLMGNVWGDGEDQGRNERIAAAWRSFDALEKSLKLPCTRENIEKIVINASFGERHLGRWSVWKNGTEKGTALLIGDISFDLEAQLSSDMEGSAEKLARDRLFKTLSTFTDPFVRQEKTKEDNTKENTFVCSVTGWNGAKSRPIISEDREFDLSDFDELEHILEGEIDQNGMFRGKVKTFGKWLDGTVEIGPKGNIPTRSDSRVGPFQIRIGKFEELRNTTLTKEIHSQFVEQAERYSGLMVFRDGLRVMPYGREDNDFFEIEKRRTQHAGREFWINHRMFGRVALTRKDNPNLKDKAGREGIIDNRAAKGFKDLVENILMSSARRFFGTDSEIRKSELPVIKERFDKEKAEKEQKTLRTKKRKLFRKNLNDLSPKLQEFTENLESLAEGVRLGNISRDEAALLKLQESLSEHANQIREFSLGEAPDGLGMLENKYYDYRKNQRQAKSLIDGLTATVVKILEEIKPKQPREIAQLELKRNEVYLGRRIRGWKKDAFSLLESEKKRIEDKADELNKSYHSRMLPLLDDIEHGRIELGKALNLLSSEKDRQDSENADMFEPYINALESLQQSIDLEGLASFGMEEADKLREELNRLNSLAQLGITVEIIGHELESLDMTISRGLREMPTEVKDTEQYEAVKTAYEDLTNRLRFLSPLKLSGDKVKRWISGREIFDYTRKFFGEVLDKNDVRMEMTPAFENFRVYEQPARLFPVFINLVNNSRYWVCRSKESRRQILLDVIFSRVISEKNENIVTDEGDIITANGKVVVADDGPGVEEDDLKHLFALFFTRKIRGGRGVGLYLCRANLSSGGHTIQYATESEEQVLSGANFIIDFKGAEYAS